jgi:hypothetical protein
MKKLNKDVLRYIILAGLSWFAIESTYEIIEFALKKPDMSTQIASLLGAISTAILGTWSYYIKKFSETSATDA